MAEKTKAITVRLTPEEHALVREAAELDHREVAGYVRIHLVARAILDTAKGVANP